MVLGEIATQLLCSSVKCGEAGLRDCVSSRRKVLGSHTCLCILWDT